MVIKKLMHKETWLIGEEIDGKIVLQKTDWWETIEESKVPDSWESLWSVRWYYVDSTRGIYGWWLTGCDLDIRNKNTRPTRELAEACLAMSQLAQLRNKTWENCGNWEPDWRHDYQEKYVIAVASWKFWIETHMNKQRFLAFPTKDIAIEFLEKHQELIETAKPLL